MNFGVGGFGLDQAYLRYQKMIREFELPTVLLGFMPENMSRHVNTYRPFYFPGTGLPLGAVTQTAIFASRGFVRLMGIGHIYWVPLIPWLWSRLDGFPPAGPFAMWLTSVMLLNSVSLIIDVGDVARYLNGDRTPHLTAG